MRFRRIAHSETNHWEAEHVIRRFGWRVRLFACWGTPPGSHIGFWRTRIDDMHGWNLRIGRKYVGPCLTMLIHVRRL